MKNLILRAGQRIFWTFLIAFYSSTTAIAKDEALSKMVTLPSYSFIYCETGHQPGNKIGFCPVLFPGYSPDPPVSPVLRPIGYPQFEKISLQAGSLRAVIVDNSDYPPHHHKGYNGIAELYHAEQDSNVFVPDFAGLNLEHIFNGESPLTFFEPRKNPMELYRKSENEILLYQPPTPESKNESLLELKMVAPDYIDYTVRYVFHDEEFFKHNYASVFYASYINQPADLSVYFEGIREGDTKRKSRIIQAFTPVHGEKSTHRSISDPDDIYFAPDFSITLADHFSDSRYTQSWLAGRFHNMVLAYFFHSSDFIRFSQSPNGAGEGNPAWDFYYIIPNPKAGEEYSFSGRILYKPYAGERNLKKEYKKWHRRSSKK